MIHVGNAPCSWGTLEFEAMQADRIGYAQMLDEVVETGYTGVELGDWGFMPTEPVVLRAELDRRGLTMTGAFVPVRFADPAAHDEGESRAVRTARLLAAVARPDSPPFLVLSDDNASDPTRARHAGRVTPEMGLDDARWRTFADGVNRIARAVTEATGLPVVFHHHCAGFVETPDEIARLLELTDPRYVGLVFDTGHYAWGSGAPNAEVVMHGLVRFWPRVWYVHLKDCAPEVARRATDEGWDYHIAVRHGVFCELGQGCVPFDRVIAWLRQRDYRGYVTVEQDVLPGMGAPKESAQRNRAYLRHLGI
ncbi:MAG: TIM barrel protein [Anaerolineae bacterium]|nr:TIM barrel protein [Anaerolineae bacterium]